MHWTLLDQLDFLPRNGLMLDRIETGRDGVSTAPFSICPSFDHKSDGRPATRGCIWGPKCVWFSSLAPRSIRSD